MNQYDEIRDHCKRWIGVPVPELVELGIAEQITSSSRLDEDLAWLDEDGDLGTWLKALAEKFGVKPGVFYQKLRDERTIVTTQVAWTYIRELPPFCLQAKRVVGHT